jgi:hypothetical protein
MPGKRRHLRTYRLYVGDISLFVGLLLFCIPAGPQWRIYFVAAGFLCLGVLLPAGLRHYGGGSRGAELMQALVHAGYSAIPFALVSILVFASGRPHGAETMLGIAGILFGGALGVRLHDTLKPPYPLHAAVRRGLCEQVARTLGDFPDLVDAPGEGDWTPLHWATMAGHADVVRLLLEAGADPSIRDGRGRTALQLALNGRRKRIVDLLGEHGEKEAGGPGGLP